MSSKGRAAPADPGRRPSDPLTYPQGVYNIHGIDPLPGWP